MWQENRETLSCIYWPLSTVGGAALHAIATSFLEQGRDEPVMEAKCVVQAPVWRTGGQKGRQGSFTVIYCKILGSKGQAFF